MILEFRLGPLYEECYGKGREISEAGAQDENVLKYKIEK